MIQTAEQERLWWNVATPENLWNGPGDGLWQADHIESGLRGIPDGPVLDLGAGDGRLLTRLAELHPERNWIGLDLVARRPGYPMPPNAAFLLGDGRTIPSADESWAGVYSVLLFQHLPEEAVRGYIAEAFRVLQPGGKFVFQFVTAPGDPDGFLHYRYDPRSMLGWCQDAGFPLAGGGPVDDLGWYWIAADKGAPS